MPTPCRRSSRRRRRRRRKKERKKEKEGQKDKSKKKRKIKIKYKKIRGRAIGVVHVSICTHVDISAGVHSRAGGLLCRD